MIILPSARRVRGGLSRRGFLKRGAQAAAYVALARALAACGGGGDGNGAGDGARLAKVGALGEPLDIGIRIPRGFSARVIARAGETIEGTALRWHSDPDGGATFATDDGGWIYVSNREFLPGGVDAIRFDAGGAIVDAYNVLPGALTRINCSGGATPWKTWMSGEEYDLGIVWECDPWGVASPTPLRALGTFAHEAVAVDPRTNIVYETEDKPDGRFYRFVPDTPNVGGKPDLARGTLQVMRVLADPATVAADGLLPATKVEWLDVPDPNPVLGGVLIGKPTREQVPESTAFDGGEGIWHHEGLIYFTTKGDRKIWAHDTAAGTLACVYDDSLYAAPVLDSVDNILVTPGGDLVVVEDKSEANQQAVAITPDGAIFPLIELSGQQGSEVTGPAFSPDGRHFYFSSQRGPGADAATGSAGVTYCVSGPWFGR
ncbi:alkaline phosphatase PhoX [Solimonas soli]|uniref:alkaline phosphatase PhoX n=1 Tax=Solimonas soli TaxID=413479 RepID=UPI0009FFA66E|nr:alkaline phosphatase PhoX [Solimonas soli]